MAWGHKGGIKTGRKGGAWGNKEGSGSGGCGDIRRDIGT